MGGRVPSVHVGSTDRRIGGPQRNLSFVLTSSSLSGPPPRRSRSSSHPTSRRPAPGQGGCHDRPRPSSLTALPSTVPPTVVRAAVVEEYATVRSRVLRSSPADQCLTTVIPTRLPSRRSRNTPPCFIDALVTGVEGEGGHAAAPSSSSHPPPRTTLSSARLRSTAVGAAAAAAAVGVVFLVAWRERERMTNATAV